MDTKKIFNNRNYRARWFISCGTFIK